MSVDIEADSKKSSEETTRPIFSAEDRREIVSSFAKAFLSGKIKVFHKPHGMERRRAVGGGVHNDRPRSKAKGP